MKNLPSFFLIFFLTSLVSCSFDNKTGVWKEHNKNIIKKPKSDDKREKIFKRKKIFDQEIESRDLVIVSKKQKNTLKKRNAPLT